MCLWDPCIVWNLLSISHDCSGVILAIMIHKKLEEVL